MAMDGSSGDRVPTCSPLRNLLPTFGQTVRLIGVACMALELDTSIAAEVACDPMTLPGTSVHPCSFAEVRIDPTGTTLFGSTRGLEARTKGYVCAWDLLPSGLIRTDGDTSDRDDGEENDNIAPVHSYRTPTSGGWANAIAVSPLPGPRGSTWLSLTDSEVGTMSILDYTRSSGFRHVARFDIPQDQAEGEAGSTGSPGSGVIGASVAVWL